MHRKLYMGGVSETDTHFVAMVDEETLEAASVPETGADSLMP